MTAAKNKPAGWAGRGGVRCGKSLSCNNIPQIYSKGKRLAERLHMPFTELQNVACVWALLFLDAAPRSVWPLFSGKPSLYSDKARLLTLAFYIVFVEATDRLEALKIKEDVDAVACWKLAIGLVGGAI